MPPTRTRWEYLTVKWESSVNASTSPPTHDERLIAVRSGQPPVVLGEGEGTLTVFDQLGADGWELVSETVIETASFAQSRGYHQITAPINVRFRFKRPLTSD